MIPALSVLLICVLCAVLIVNIQTFPPGDTTLYSTRIIRHIIFDITRHEGNGYCDECSGTCMMDLWFSD